MLCCFLVQEAETAITEMTGMPVLKLAIDYIFFIFSADILA
jgi:hypothetical protein